MNKVIILERTEDNTVANAGNLSGIAFKNYRYDCTTIKLVKPENALVEETRKWSRQYIKGKYNLYEQGIVTNDKITTRFYFDFEDESDAVYFKMTWIKNDNA